MATREDCSDRKSERRYQTIVVGYDATEASERALAQALDIAQAFRAKLVVATVEPIVVPVDVTPVTAGGFALPLVLEDDAESDPWDRFLENARSTVEGRGVVCEFVLPVGQPDVELVRVAEEHGADLIVVGNHEPGLLERLFTTSVSAGIRRRARCDVLLVHSPSGGGESPESLDEG